MGRKLTEEHKLKLRLAKLGKKQTKEHIENSAKTRIGRKVSEETREKIRKSLTGKKLPFKERPNAKGRKPWNKGKKMSPEQKINSGRKKGFTAYNKGFGAEKKICPKCNGAKANSYATFCKNCTEKTAWNKGEKMPERTGDKHILWKGLEAGYEAKHASVKRLKGKAKKCSNCGKEGTGREIHWANIDHKYSRNPDDYIELCQQCHAIYDKENGLRKRKKITLPAI